MDVTRISGKQILMVDDDDSLRRGLAWLLEYEGAIRHQFESGVAEVDWLEGNPNSCDAIIFDGMTAVKHIREVLEIIALAIIATTG